MLWTPLCWKKHLRDLLTTCRSVLLSVSQFFCSAVSKPVSASDPCVLIKTEPSYLLSSGVFAVLRWIYGSVQGLNCTSVHRNQSAVRTPIRCLGCECFVQWNMTGSTCCRNVGVLLCVCVRVCVSVCLCVCVCVCVCIWTLTGLRLNYSNGWRHVTVCAKFVILFYTYITLTSVLINR